MKMIFFLVFALINTFYLYSQNKSLLIKYQWGSTMDLIIMNEGIPNDKYENEIFPKDLRSIIYINKMIAENLTNVSYYFFDNKLHMINYSIFGTYTIKKWVEIYFYLRDEFKNIYGDYVFSGSIPDETDEQMIERFTQYFSVPIEEDEFFNDRFDKMIFHHILWNYLDTVIEMEFTYNYSINDIIIEIMFFSPDYFKNVNDLWHRK